MDGRTKFGLSIFLFALGCTMGTGPVVPDPDGGAVFLDAGPRDSGPLPDRGPLSSDAACALGTSTATVEPSPVDIIWVIDNSVTMEDSIRQVQAGLNDFAELIASRDLDYRVIMLSRRGVGRTDQEISGSYRYQVCIPEPLAGDANCGDNPGLFYHVDVDIKSTQLIEQLLGTLAQTEGYRDNEARGSAPWAHLLRPEATKTIVVVTDDNARTCERRDIGSIECQDTDPALTATSLENFPGGGNPFNSNELGPGLLRPTYGSMFEGYTFAGIYGWGSETNPDTRCQYANDDYPVAAGHTYTTLVQRTNGVRAQICDAAAAWGPFFSAIASAVVRTARPSCVVDIPEPPAGLIFQHDRINVFIDVGFGPLRIARVAEASACDARGGWYYDNELVPTSVTLCPATCGSVQTAEAPRVDVEFGCQSDLF